MSSVTPLNFALHSLLLSVGGWMLVRWCLRDARQRAWAALAMLIIVTAGPLFIACWPAHLAADAPDMTPSLPVQHSAWKPEWKITLSQSPPSMIHSSFSSLAEPSAFPLTKYALALWMIGFVLLAFRHAKQSLKTSGRRSSLRPLRSFERATLPRFADASRLRVFDGPGSPFVVGLMDPQIAVPAEALVAFTADQWRWLLRHESGHLSGRDPLIAWLLGWMRALWWWNPFVHALIEHWTQAREEVCDSLAAQQNEGASYANFLLDVAEGSLMEAGVMSMAASRPARRLRARLRALLDMKRVRERVGITFAFLMIAFSIGGLALVSCTGVVEDAPVTATSVPPTKEDDTQLTRVFKVPPDFLSHASREQSTAKMFLQEQGISFPEGASAVYNTATSQLIVKNTEGNLRRIAEYIEDHIMRAPALVHLTARFVEGDAPLGKHGEVMNNPSFQTMIRQASQRKGADLMTSPSVTTRLGQRAIVEVVKEEPHPAAGNEPRFVGVRLEAEPGRTDGPAILLNAKATVGCEEGKPIGALNGDIDWDKVRQFSAERQALLLSDQTLVLHLGKVSLGRFVTVLVTAGAITPTGTPARSFDAKFPPPSPAKATEISQKQSEAARRQDMLEAKKNSEIDAKTRIALSVKIVDFTTKKETDPDTIFDWLTGGIETIIDTTDPESKAKPPASPAKIPFPSNNAIAGVFTDPQFRAIWRTLGQRKDINVTSLPNKVVASGEKVIYDKIKAPNDPVELKVESVPGPDGFTIDLAISLPSDLRDAKSRPITTAVTIWDGQTVCLGGLLQEDEKSRDYRLTFVTARKILLPAPRK